MADFSALDARSGSLCELCKGTDALEVFNVPPHEESSDDQAILLCQTCRSALTVPAANNSAHWHCLSESMWSEVPAVQVMAWRILNALSSEAWAQDLLDQLYLDEETLGWAQAGAELSDEDDGEPHKDSNGGLLASGDNVTLIKDLNVKGAGFTAKRGTVVRGISLVHDNPSQIEGRVNGQRIVILCEFVRKSA